MKITTAIADVSSVGLNERIELKRQLNKAGFEVMGVYPERLNVNDRPLLYIDVLTQIAAFSMRHSPNDKDAQKRFDNYAAMLTYFNIPPYDTDLGNALYGRKPV